jgi:polar amino acid transport system permease protein
MNLPGLDLLPPLLRGLWLTIVITCGGCALALVCALLAGLGRRSNDVIVRIYATTYVELFRGTSALVQLFWFFYALPLLLGIEINAILAGILVLGLNIGAYGAEVVRASIEAVPKGQTHAAYALNLSRWQTMRHVILPQAALMMLPPFGNLMIELLKSTALVSMITVTDLLRAGLFLRADTHRSIEIFGLLLLIYFGLSLIITTGVRWLERRFSYGIDYGGAR